MSMIQIGGRAVGDGQPCYFIAEAGVNHNGDVELAERLVELAAHAGADAVKFQKRTPSEILISAALDRPYTGPTSLGATYGEHRERLELTADDYARLVDTCRRHSITFLASAWDERSADFVEALGIPAFKTASADLTNLGLLDHIARKGKPVLLSTGMSDLDEIAQAVDVVRAHNDQLILLQCTSTYPAENHELNLCAMDTLRRRFDVPVGYSGHERGLAPSIAAAARGAAVIERHFTVDRAMPGPDHAASLEPPGLTTLIRDIHNVEQALGSGEKAILDSERPIRERLAKSVVAREAITAGSAITRARLGVKGPGTGIPPRDMHRLEGVVARCDIPADTLVPVEALQWT